MLILVRSTLLGTVLWLLPVFLAVLAQDVTLPAVSDQGGKALILAKRARAPVDVLSPDQWRQVDMAVERALIWLAGQQQPDGSFPTLDHARPAVTALCGLAFMAHGHNPGEGLYGERLDRATDFLLACQKENGLVTLHGPEGPRITRDLEHEIGKAASYNHALASLTLSEMYGMGQTKRAEQIQKVVNKSILVTLEMQRWPKDLPDDRGGWRYVDDHDHSDSDLSVSGWHLMFLRSARNAGFNVPKQAIDDAVGYIRRTFDRNYGTFVYAIKRGDVRSRGMAGAGILALGHAGFHNSLEAQRSGQWLLRYSFDVYNGNPGLSNNDRYHYSLFTCCQGMYQLGSPYWEQFFPRTVRAVLVNQRSDGSWDAESLERDRPFGNAYTTAIVLLALGAPNQLLPVFQR